MIKELSHWVWEVIIHLITFRWRNLPYHFTNLWWYLRYGFTMYDIQDTDRYLTKRLADMLALYRKYYVGYPSNSTPEKWDAVLKEMEDLANETLSYDFEMLSFTKQKRKRTHFMTLVHKYFYSLWY